MSANPKKVRIVDEAVLEQRRGEHCWGCGHPPPNDASHIKTRGSGGPDSLWNVVAHCRRCHTEWGMSAIKMLKKRTAFAFRMKMLGWRWDEGRLSHPLLGVSES